MSSSLHGSVVSNFLFLFMSQYGSMVINIVFSLFLTRLLIPADFGLVAIILFYFNFSNWIAEWGWEQGFLAHKELPLDTAASSHLFVRGLSGLLPLIGCAVVLCVNPPASPTLATLMLLCAVAYFIEKVGFVYRTVLERVYNLKAMAVYEFWASVVSYLCAVAAAYAGWGVLSLGVQRIVEKSLMLCGYWRHSPWKWGVAVDVRLIITLCRSFGLASWVGSIFALVIYDFMPFFVGYCVSQHQAGLYAKAFTTATFPLMLTAVCLRLVAPLYAHYQFNTQQLRSIFIKVQAFKLVVLVPGQLFMMVTSSYWIPQLFGPAWVEMVPVYKIMAVYGLVRAFFDDVPAVLALGFKQPWELTKNQAVQAVCIVICAPVLVHYYAALGGAIAMTTAMLCAAVSMWVIALRTLHCSRATVQHEVSNLYLQGKSLLATIIRGTHS